MLYLRTTPSTHRRCFTLSTREAPYTRRSRFTPSTREALYTRLRRLNGLHIVQLLVVAVLLQQCIVGAALNDATLVQHADLVGIANGGEAMGHSHRCACLHQTLQGILHQAFALSIEGRCGLIEDEDGRVLQDGTSNTHTLSLTTRETTASVADVRIVAVFALSDELMSVGNLCSLNNLLLKVRRVLFDAKSNIVSEAIIEKDSLLVHISDELAQGVQTQVLYVDAIDEHFAFLYVVVARDKIDERRFYRHPKARR